MVLKGTMKPTSLVITVFLFALFTPLLAKEQETREYPSPKKFENAIKAFEKQDAKKAPPENAIVCIGSSSMRMWKKDINEDLGPLTLIPRGFGGSNMNDALHYADRIVLNYKPRAILLYSCDNDVHQRVAHDTILAAFNSFVKKVHESLPECRIYVIAVKPSIARWKIWPEMNAMNVSLAEICKGHDLLTFIDIATPMLNEEGKPREEIFAKDRHHMNREGYLIWRDTIKPVLHKGELSHESAHKK